MFTDIFRVWSEMEFSERTINEFLAMLQRSQDMLSYTVKILGKGKKGKKSEKKIYDRDKNINTAERVIRREILVHLSAACCGNIAGCLRLMSVIKDAERIGDYVKNLFELRFYSEDADNDKQLFRQLFDTYGNDLLSLFDMVSTSYSKSDVTLAIQSADIAKALARDLEQFIRSVSESDYPPREAAILALGSQYMGRIAEHLFNISSTVFKPISDIE